MDLRRLRGAIARVGFSVLCAGVFYSAWLGVCLLTVKSGGLGMKAIVWMSAPVVTAAGFAAGISIVERLTNVGKGRFLRIFAWPLVGCAIGAGSVYRFGPMLIVFGMFGAGTVSVVLREAVLGFRKAKRA